MAPDLAILKGMYNALSDAGLPKITDDKGKQKSIIYHTVPPKTPLPWVVHGQNEVTSNYDSGEFYDVNATVHVFAENKAVCVDLATKVQNALDQQIELEGFEVTEHWFETSTYFWEQDSLTNHAVLRFYFMVQPTDQ